MVLLLFIEWGHCIIQVVVLQPVACLSLVEVYDYYEICWLCSIHAYVCIEVAWIMDMDP